MSKYKSIAISCKAYELLNKISELNPNNKKYIFVSQLIEEAYENMKQAK